MQANGNVRALARWAAALNILCAIPDGFSVATLRKLIVVTDPSATAAHVLGSEGLFRLAVVADFFGLMLFAASGALLYQVFKPASRPVALLFLVAITMGAVIQAIAGLQTMAGLTMLKAGADMTLPVAQAHALAIVHFKLYSIGYQLGLFFDAFSSLFMGVLIVRSTFMPRIIGPLMWLDGIGGLTFSIAGLLSPPLVKIIYPMIPFATVLVGEGTFYLWLIVKSVQTERWHEQAAMSLP